MDMLTLEVIAAQTPGVPITNYDGNTLHAACLLANANQYWTFKHSISKALSCMEVGSIEYAQQHEITCIRCGCDFSGGEQWTV